MKTNTDVIGTIDEIADRYRPVFESQDFIKQVYFFGSYSRGEANPDSDVDFMVS